MSSLQELCRELEATVGKPLQTSRDFDSLSSMITERMRERIWQLRSNVCGAILMRRITLGNIR